MYKYSLDSTSKKFVCPRCEKKTFVRYFNNETNEYLESNLGRCDRESNCSYHKYPEKNNSSESFPIIVKKSKSIINSDQVAIHGRNFKRNNFIQFLKNFFAEDAIKVAILKYLIGTSSFWDGATVFWQINQKQEVVTGKVMLYNSETGKRVKQPFAHINWMHKVLKIEKFNLSQCLFGLHLINEYSGSTIAIVESEKSAIIMSILFPNYLWLATGSKSNFKMQLLEPIKKFKIITFPDNSEYCDWQKTCDELKGNGFDIICSKKSESEKYQKGFDLVDIYIELFKKNNSNSSINLIINSLSIVEKLKIKYPCFKLLINEFDLIG
jgi:hypothetical protein